MQTSSTVRATIQTFSAGEVSAFHRQILGKICVQAPYNRLTALAPQGEGSVTARVVFESPAGFDAGQLASAEIGRHLAIGGSCALARHNPSGRRHYYLARRARLHRIVDVDVWAGEELSLLARPLARDRAEAFLMTSYGETIARLDCSYQVLSDRLFARCFRKNFVPEAPERVSASPYAAPVVLTEERHDALLARALLRAVTPELCVGHFHDYPAMPVAVLMDGIQRLACRHIDAVTGRPFRLRECSVEADQLAFAGEAVEFVVEQTSRDRQGLSYRGQARRLGEGTVFGDVRIRYDLLARDSEIPTSGIRTVSGP